MRLRCQTDLPLCRTQRMIITRSKILEKCWMYHILKQELTKKKLYPLQAPSNINENDLTTSFETYWRRIQKIRQTVRVTTEILHRAKEEKNILHTRRVRKVKIHHVQSDREIFYVYYGNAAVDLDPLPVSRARFTVVEPALFE